MRKHLLTFLVILMCIAGCEKELEVIIPNQPWDLFEHPDAMALTSTTRNAMEGIYVTRESAEVFGAQLALKWSYSIESTDTLYRLSFLGEKDVVYFLMQGKRLGDSILLKGNWRKMVNTETGAVQLTISYEQGARQLFSSSPVIAKDSIILEGFYGEQENAPSNKISFSYLRPLNASPFQILAHRAGGRTSDLLPYSENSIGMIRFAPRLGATGVEIDVRMTKDHIPILYHDNTLNLRLIQKNALIGPIENYTYNQLDTYVRLIDGQRIPTLRSALFAILYQTPLTYVWLDTKYEGSLEKLVELQQEFHAKAAVMGRQLEIVIGLPTEETFNYLKALPNFTSVPSLCELTIEQVQEVNARVWAPRFTLGLQNEAVSQMHAQGRKCFVWTLDEPQYVVQFINQGNFDGILSNYPTLIAYHHYAK